MKQKYLDIPEFDEEVSYTKPLHKIYKTTDKRVVEEIQFFNRTARLGSKLEGFGEHTHKFLSHVCGDPNTTVRFITSSGLKDNCIVVYLNKRKNLMDLYGDIPNINLNTVTLRVLELHSCKKEVMSEICNDPMIRPDTENTWLFDDRKLNCEAAESLGINAVRIDVNPEDNFKKVLEDWDVS